AMFPALAVKTPAANSSVGADKMALPAPRSLNEPIGCRFSSLRKISCEGLGEAKETSGVCNAIPRSRRAASRISSSGTACARLMLRVFQDRSRSPHSFLWLADRENAPKPDLQLRFQAT